MSRPLQTALTESNPNKLAAAMHDLDAGQAFKLVTRTERVTVTANVATLSAPAKAILACYASAGTAPGFKTPLQTGTPSAGQVAVGPSGTAVFNGTDAITVAEVVYVAVEGEPVTEEIDVTSNVGSGFASKTGALLVAAESLAGTLTGALTIVARGATPTTGQAALGATGTFVFAGADAVTRARVTYYPFPDAAAGGSVASRLAASQSL